MRRRFLLLGAFGGILAGLAFWLWPRQHANLLLITLDTTRADRLGCYGYATARTPVLDALAASGIVCDRALTVAPVTLPAHTSLFTGLYPAEHGVFTNGRGRLDDALPTLAEALEHEGYDTAAFVGSFVLNAKFGLGRGFATYDDDFAGEEPSPDALGRQRNAESVIDAALDWLGVTRSRPFFCWVHLFDPHAPYAAHADLFGGEFADRPYDAEIAYVDRQIGRLVDFLKARGLESQTLIVVAGDHGEGLGEHSALTHGMTLYDEALRVPLFFRQPGALHAGRRLAENISLVDVSPTILEMLGLAERWKVSGRSIAPALRGGPLAQLPCYAATDEPYFISGWSPLRCLTEGGWKYIRSPRVELYDLASDPAESNNLAAREPARTQTMEARLAEFESRLVARAAVSVHLSGAERRALASLGYAGGGAGAATGEAPADLPDVKDMLPFDLALDEALKLIGKGAVEAGIGRLREITRQAPQYTPAYVYLADALRLRAEYDDAVEVLTALLERQPDSRDGHCGLGQVFLDQGRPDLAIPELARSLEIDPDYLTADYQLGVAQALAGQTAEALGHFNEVIQADRRHTGARQWRANLLAGEGRTAEAIAEYRKVLEYAPDSSAAHHNLGIVLLRTGGAAEARRHLLRAVELDPRNAEFQYAFGTFLVGRREYDLAIEHLSRALKLKPEFALAEERLEEARKLRETDSPAPRSGDSAP